MSVLMNCFVSVVYELKYSRVLYLDITSIKELLIINITLNNAVFASNQYIKTFVYVYGDYS